jgi:hypothetical protein
VAGHPSSPLSTGGAGVIFEYDVAAILMSRLLRGVSVPVGIHAPVARVAFQQSNEGYPLDDVVAWGHADQSTVAPSIQIQVKRRIKITAGDSDFTKVMAAAVAACAGQSQQIKSRRLLFGLAARRSAADHLDELTELTAMAQAHAEPDKFDNLFCRGITREPLCDRLNEVLDTVANAVGTNEIAVIKPLTHQILRVLHIWQVEEGPDGRDWRAELDGLADLAAEAGKTPADIMAHLLTIAGRFGPRSGNVDADHIRDVLARFEVYLSPAGSGVRRAAAPTINASGNSTVFNGHIQNFGALNIHGRAEAPGRESGTS